MKTAAKLPATFPGHRYWKTIQGSVDAILAPMGIKRRVVSVGTQFCNYDAWTWITFAEELCSVMAKHPDRSPTSDELKQIVRRANSARCRDPHIQVAKMPARVTHRMALAISGGGYHEAWHTKYSKRDHVRINDVQDIVDMIDEVTLAGGQFDAKMRGLLTTLQHLIEDIRIERRGNEDFPGAEQPMRDLQDFILDLEKRGRAKGAKIKNITVSDNARSILLCALRDLGLGYNTHKSRAALDYYRQTAPGAVALLAPGGILAPFVHEAKNLAADDKMGSLRVAMKIVIALWRATQTQDEQPAAPQTCCPNCGAGPSGLVIRSVRDENGAKIRGRAEVECKACGFRHEFDLPDNSLDLDQNRPKQDADAERPEVEDLGPDDVGEGSDGFGHDSRERMRDAGASAGDGTSSDGDRDEDDDGRDDDAAVTHEPSRESDDEGSEFEDLNESDLIDYGDEDADLAQGGPDEGPDGSHGGTAREDGDADHDGGREDPGDDPREDEAAGHSLDSEAEDEERGTLEAALGGSDVPGGTLGRSAGDDGEPTEEDRDAPGEGADASALEWNGADEDWEMDGLEFLRRLHTAPGAGGVFDLGQDPDSLFEMTDQIFAGTELDGILNNMDGLELATAAHAKEDFRDLEPGEMAWNPYDPMSDEARVVRSGHRETDQERANAMLAEVRETVVYLRARLRNIVRAQEFTDTTHGVRRGRKLSNRRLVDTAIELRSGQNPTRPYQITDTQMDTSVALCIVLDQSGSMCSSLYAVSQAMMIMADCIESIGGKTMALGFRDGADSHYSGPSSYGKSYHRVHGVRYDIFKTWDEMFVNAKWRFAHTQAYGGTPMSDGVQYGLMALNERTEAHRILWVITDGCPNRPHEKVIRRQLRLAKAAGIHVVGNGIGDEAAYVKNLFPDHVWTDKVRDLPQPVVAKLNELCDFAGRYRGRKAKLDGKIVRRVS